MISISLRKAFLHAIEISCYTARAIIDVLYSAKRFCLGCNQINDEITFPYFVGEECFFRSATESGIGGGGNDSRRSSSDHPGSQSQDASWQCPTCTYSNLFSLYSCEICSTKKPSSR